jgi:hypothetical protein
MHNVVENAGYQDLELDFTHCTAAFAGPMLAIASRVQHLLIKGVDTDLQLPADDTLRRLFLNTNWAHFIDFRRYEPSAFRGTAQIPALKFADFEQQNLSVNSVLDRILVALSGFNRSHLRAIEWSINEITDNVINHSQSPVGGLLQVTNFSKKKRTIQYAVSDAGIGIPHTLRSGHPELNSDADALDRAIREGITRDPAAGQGNGLYGSWRVSVLSGGSFEIQSGNATLISLPKTGLHIRTEKIPLNGTVVIVEIDYSKPLLLEEALRFGGKPHTPLDVIDLAYEEMDGKIVFRLKDESQGFGTRAAGRPIYQKLLNLSRLTDGKPIEIDLHGIPVISSSYADELFGKLYIQFGPLEFGQRFRIVHVDSVVRSLIDRAIEQRMKASHS